MAVAFDAVGPSSAGTSGSNVATLSWTHTPVGSSVAAVAVVAVGTSTTAQNGYTLSVTYGGTAMTSLGKVFANNINTGFSGYVQMFGITGRSAGAATVAVTASGAPTSLEAGSVSFTGAASFGTAVTAFGSSTTPSVAVTGASVNNMVVDGVVTGTSVTSSAKTNRWLKNLNTSTGGGNAAESSSASAAGSVTMSYTVTTDVWGIVAVEVIAAAVAATSLPSPVIVGQAVKRSNFY